MTDTQTKRYKVRIEINPGYVYRRVSERIIVARNEYKALAHAMTLESVQRNEIGDVTVEVDE